MSRSLLAAVLLVSLTGTGCVAHGKHRDAATVVNGILVVGGGALAIGAGTSLGAMEPADNGLEALGQGLVVPYLVGATVIGLGVAVVGGAGIFQSYAYDDAPVAAPAPAIVVAPAPGPSSYAVHLTAQARTLAAAGRCGAVRLIETDVAIADPAYHADVFRTDPALVRCQ